MSSGSPSDQLVRDYRLLLRDGIVIRRRDCGSEDVWTTALRELAIADGLRAGVCYLVDHCGGTPCVELRRRHGGQYPTGGGSEDQEELGAVHRPFAEDDWGETLTAARLRRGVETAP